MLYGHRTTFDTTHYCLTDNGMNDDRNFGFEIDFLPVGNGEDSGDSICMRWGYGLNTDSPEQFVVVVDGGYAETGEETLRHLKKFYFRGGLLPLDVDVVISTHPHQDHISGLKQIIEGANEVKLLIMHMPWHHDGLKAWFDSNGNLKETTIRDKLKAGLSDAVELEKQARSKGVIVTEAFSPCSSKELCGCSFKILSPSKTFYEALLPDFNASPGHGFVDRGKRLKPTGRRVAWSFCPLDCNGETSAENESSVVVLIKVTPKDRYILLTADAGKLALGNVAKYIIDNRLDINKIDIFQVPHHGSIQNLSPELLNVFLGSRKKEECRTFERIAIASVSDKADEDHPSDAVRNAILERGVRFCATEGGIKWFWYGSVPRREGYTDIEYDNEPSAIVREFVISTALSK